MAQCATTALADAVPRPYVRGARGWFEGLGPVPRVVSLPFPPSRPACPALRVAGRPVRVSLILARWYAIPRGLCVPRAQSGCPSGSPRVPFACVCARAPAASAPPPLGGVACAPGAVPALGAGRAVPRGPCPSACPAPVPCYVWCAWGGQSGPGSPLPRLGLCAPRGAGPWRMPCGGCVPRGRRGAVPGGGRPASVVRGVWCQALSLPRLPVLWSGQPGFRDPCVQGAVGAGLGTQHRPHSVRPCGPALLAVGVAERRPWGGCLPPL